MPDLPAAIPDPVRHGDEIPFPKLPTTRMEQHAIPYHHVLLDFRDDDHALLFRQWLVSGDGWASFGSYVNAQEARNG